MNSNANNMDSELASIVSSLSALSNGNNNPGSHQQQQHLPQQSQLGGYRRSSVGASSNNQELDVYAASMQPPPPPHSQTRAALSVGTAPAYSKQRTRLLNNHYSASIAGPIMFTEAVGAGGGGGFFEKFGKSLIEGTRELEKQPSEQDGPARRASVNSESPEGQHKTIWNVAQAPVFKPNQDTFNQFPLSLASQYPATFESNLESQQRPNLEPNQQPFFYMSSDISVPPQPAPKPQSEPKHYSKPTKKQQTNPYLDVSKKFTNNTKSPTRIASPSQPHQQQQHTPHNAPKHANITSRSPLLEEFRSNTNEKVYSLKDIVGYVLEFCKDQHGSRFIQHELSVATNSEREVIFNEIRDFAIELSDDVFGNYVIQKFFEFGSKTQKDILVHQFKGRMKFLSMKMYSCRVIQKSLEYIDLQQRIDLVNELSNCVLQMIKDQNGNHVIQKSIERIQLKHLPFILDSLNGQIYHLSTHSYGCRVIQRLLEFGNESDQLKILVELMDFIPYLIQDQYGNYVIQHILQQNSKTSFDEMIKIKQKIIEIVSKNVVEFSKHKFASNVVEKAILFGSPDQKKLIVSQILPIDENHAVDLNDNSPLILMMKDQFANYVVQKLVGVSKGNDQKLIVIAIRSYLERLNKSDSMGNRHLASVEKLASLVENVKI